MKNSVQSVKAPHIPAVPAYIADAKKLAALEDEHQQLSVRMKAIQTEASTIYASLRSRIAPEFIGSIPFGKRVPERPRPVEDKIVISAGRAIVSGLRRGLTPDQSKSEAIQAATKVAKRYGMNTLPISVTESIDRKIQNRYNLFNAPGTSELKQ